MQKYKLTKMSEKQERQGSKGPFFTIGIQTEQTGDKWINGYSNVVTDKWKIGDEIEIAVTDKEVNGKTYKNFSLPKKEDLTKDAVMSLRKDFQKFVFETYPREMKELEHKLRLELSGKVLSQSELDSVNEPIFGENGEAIF